MKKITFLSQQQEFTGYLFPKKEIDLGKAWEKVKADWAVAEKHSQELAKHPGTQPINEDAVNQYHELKLSENE